MMKYYMVSTVGSIEAKSIETIGKFDTAVKTLRLLLPIVGFFKRRTLAVTVILSVFPVSSDTYAVAIVHEGNQISDTDRDLANKLVKTLRTISGLVKE